MSTDRTRTLEQSALVALAAGLGLIQLTIFGWVPLLVAGVLWFLLLRQDGFHWAVPAFFWPLVALALWTLVSCAFSSEPGASFFRSRQLLFYLLVPLTMRVARGPAAMRVLDVIIAVGAFGALAGVVEYAFMNYRSLGARPSGFLGHYMTFSGIIMLVLCAAFARLVYRGREWIWPSVAVPALLCALIVSEARNAWLGALAAIVLLLSLRSWKLLVAVPILVAVLAVLAPAIARDRARSIFDPSDPTNRDRIAMLESGRLMIEDHPLVGVGMNMVPKEYSAKYKTPDAVDPPDKPGDTRSHLHNVPVQLAAERGLPALAAWVWLVVVAARDLLRLVRRSTTPAIAATGLAALVAMIISGLFEYNIGHTEFLVLFLGLISLPFAADSALPPPDTAGLAVPVLVGGGPSRSAHAADGHGR
jgi:putative inorganic carbon (HCO3(-)) transporter